MNSAVMSSRSRGVELAPTALLLFDTLLALLVLAAINSFSLAAFVPTVVGTISWPSVA